MSRRGHQRERDWVLRLREIGWWAQRAPGSLGIDVIASSPSLEHDGAVLHFYEVKSDVGSPWTHFGPADRRALFLQAERAGAVPFVVWWPPRAQPKVIPVEDWPAFEVAA